MKIKINNMTDFYSGSLFIAFGAIFAYIARNYTFGTALRMGSGYFPMVLSFLLMLIGAVVLFRSIASSEVEGAPEISLKPFAIILGSLFIFGFFLAKAGLILSSLFLVLASSAASSEFSLKYALPSAVLLTVACYLIFIYGLGLPIPVWPGIF